MEKERLVQLVQDAQGGDNQAMDALFTEFYNDVYYFALKTVKDSDLACDITQETFLKVIQNIGELKEPVAFVTWMKQIAYHQCTHYFSKKKEVLVEEDEDGNTIFDTLPDDGEMPAEVLEQEEFRQTILSMIAQLTEEQRAAVLLYYFDELTVAQIAQIQGVSEGTVKSRLNYARKAIKKSVESYEKKHDVKLHSVALLPLLLLFFGRAKMPEDKAKQVRGAVFGASKDAAAVVTAATVKTTSAAKAAGGIFMKLASWPLWVKIVAGVVALALVGGIVALIATDKDSDKDNKKSNKPKTSATESIDDSTEPDGTKPGQSENTTPTQPDEATTPTQPDEATTPTQPEDTTPDWPENVTPEQPGNTTPSQPGNTTPNQPENTTPEQPGNTTPEQPDNTTPEQPGNTTPSQPENTTPTQPSGPKYKSSKLTPVRYSEENQDVFNGYANYIENVFFAKDGQLLYEEDKETVFPDAVTVKALNNTDAYVYTDANGKKFVSVRDAEVSADSVRGEIFWVFTSSNVMCICSKESDGTLYYSAIKIYNGEIQADNQPLYFQDPESDILYNDADYISVVTGDGYMASYKYMYIERDGVAYSFQTGGINTVGQATIKTSARYVCKRGDVICHGYLGSESPLYKKDGDNTTLYYLYNIQKRNELPLHLPAGKTVDQLTRVIFSYTTYLFFDDGSVYTARLTNDAAGPTFVLDETLTTLNRAGAIRGIYTTATTDESNFYRVVVTDLSLWLDDDIVYRYRAAL